MFPFNQQPLSCYYQFKSLQRSNTKPVTEREIIKNDKTGFYDKITMYGLFDEEGLMTGQGAVLLEKRLYF